MSNYKDLDLSLFRLNEKAEPLALPWIEQEPHLILKLECEEKEGREFRRGIHRLLNTLQSFRQFYLQPFAPSTHLMGDGAMFTNFRELERFEVQLVNHYNIQHIPTGKVFAFTIALNDDPVGNRFSSERQNYFYPKNPEKFINFFDDRRIPLIWTPHAVRLLLGIEEGVDA